MQGALGLERAKASSERYARLPRPCARCASLLVNAAICPIGMRIKHLRTDYRIYPILSTQLSPVFRDKFRGCHQTPDGSASTATPHRRRGAADQAALSAVKAVSSAWSKEARRMASAAGTGTLGCPVCSGRLVMPGSASCCTGWAAARGSVFSRRQQSTTRGSDAEHIHGCSPRSHGVRTGRKCEHTVCVGGRRTHPHKDGCGERCATPEPADLQCGCAPMPALQPGRPEIERGQFPGCYQADGPKPHLTDVNHRLT